MHKGGEQRSQRAPTMSFNSASEAEKRMEMSLKRSLFSGVEEEDEEEDGGGAIRVRVNVSTVLNLTLARNVGMVTKEQLGRGGKKQRPKQSCVSGASKAQNLK